MIINERVKRDCGLGDFRTPEQSIPGSRPDREWETCLTMNDHWGYHAEDRQWKSAQDLVRNLADVASKGGNLLLNVGPKPEGTLPRESRECLRAVGRWMRAFGESIYGTSAGPFAEIPAGGRCTEKRGRIYLHVFLWPQDRTLRLPPIRNPVRRAFPLGRPGRQLPFRITQEGVRIDLPARAPDPWDSVIGLEVDGMPAAA